MCVPIAPELLDLDEDGQVLPLNGGHVPDSERRIAELVVDTCPAQALRLIERGSGVPKKWS
jgi:ferredoxin